MFAYNSVISAFTELVYFSKITALNFRECTNLASVAIPEKITSIGMSNFYHCALTSIDIPTQVTSLESYSFASNPLTTLTLHEGLITIGSRAFLNNSQLSSVVIPSSVTSMGDMCFAGCTGMTEMILSRTTPPTLGSNAFATSTFTIYVPDSAVATYKAASSWSSYASRVKGISERPTQ